MNVASWTDADRLAWFEYQRRQASRRPLPHFIAATPGNERPDHLAPLAAALEQAERGEQVRLGFSVPPQHGKSEMVLHALIWMLLRDPTKRHAFATYNDDFTRDQQKRARRIADRHGLRLAQQSTSRWVTPEGGGILWTSRRGGITGSPVDGVVVLDDLLKDRSEAISTAIKREAMDFIRSAVMTRLHPGSSVVLIATRWAQDDPIGQLGREGWTTINLPAISDDGTALWPEQRPLDFLEGQRREMGEWDFEALFMGRPRPRGAEVFKGARYFDELPAGGYEEAHGFDAAYTAKTHADYSVTVTGRLYGEDLYITNMIRAQLEPRQYIARLKAEGVKRVTWFLSGTEKGLVAFLRDQGIAVRDVPATGDKFVRAQPSAAGWNAGRILVPSLDPNTARHGLQTDWVEPFLGEVNSFTGVADVQDDIIDALAALYHALIGGPTLVGGLITTTGGDA